MLCTNGDKGTTDPTVDPDGCAPARAAECDEAAKLLGLTGQHVLGYGTASSPTTGPSGANWWVGSGACARTMVLCPDPTAVFFGEDYFNHRDHRIVGFAVLDALVAGGGAALYFPDAVRSTRSRRRLLSGTLEADGVGGHHRPRSTRRRRPFVPPEPVRR